MNINSNRIKELDKRKTMHKYLLLNPLDNYNFGCTIEEMLEALEEFGCSYISSLDTTGQVMYYATAVSKKALEQMCTTVELDGSIIEYTAIYDQVFES